MEDNIYDLDNGSERSLPLDYIRAGVGLAGGGYAYQT